MKIEWDTVVAEYVDMLLNATTETAIQKTQLLLESGVTPTEFFENCITPALKEVGRLFETLEIFLPEMVAAADMVEQINVRAIRPAIESGKESGENIRDITVAGKVCMASIKGDLHDIGKNMVTLLLRVNGFEVTDLGTNVLPQDIVNFAEREQVDIIGLSSLLTSCLPYMKDVVDILQSKGVRDNYAVIVGGAAPTEEFTEKIGADAHGHNAAEAVRICKKIVATKRF